MNRSLAKSSVSVHSDQPDSLIAVKEQGVAVHHSDHCAPDGGRLGGARFGGLALPLECSFRLSLGRKRTPSKRPAMAVVAAALPVMMATEGIQTSAMPMSEVKGEEC